MPRQARVVFADVALHVRQVGHDGGACFRRDDDYLVYLSCLGDLLRRTACRLHAYCLMTNHVHLLLTPPAGEACAMLMRGLGQRYVQYFNRRYERSGTLWEGRFRSCLVDSATYVLACHRYIERNPVKAGMVPAASDYSWSSYAGNAGYVHNPLLSPHAEYVALGAELQPRLAAYRELVAQPDDPAFLAAVRDATNGGFALVGESLRSKLPREVLARLDRKPPGRPAPTPPADQPELLGELGLRPRTS